MDEEKGNQSKESNCQGLKFIIQLRTFLQKSGLLGDVFNYSVWKLLELQKQNAELKMSE